MLAFADRKDFRSEMANQLIAHPQIDEMISHPSSVSTSIHSTDAGTFRLRAISALRDGTVSVIHGVANNLRVFGDATDPYVAVVQAYGGYSDPVAKRGAIHVIAYMGKVHRATADPEGSCALNSRGRRQRFS